MIVDEIEKLINQKRDKTKKNNQKNDKQITTKNLAPIIILMEIQTWGHNFFLDGLSLIYRSGSERKEKKEKKHVGGQSFFCHKHVLYR